MPDIVLSDYKLSPTSPNNGATPNYANTGGNASLDSSNLFQQRLLDIAKMQTTNARNSQMNIPVVTTLDDTLRYTDPNLGFNPFDSRLEYKYAEEHPYQTLGNNLLQGGARFLGAAVEAISTIPIAINSLAEGDFSKMYDNPITNSISEYLDKMNSAFPTYESEYSANHPILKYLSVWKPTTFANAWGGAINNFGYTAGAIAGALVEDTIITAITGGTGLLPALGANASQFVSKLGKAARIVATNTDEAIAGTRALVLAGAEATETGLMTTRGLANAADNIAANPNFIRAEGDGLTQGAVQADELLQGANPRNKILNRADTYYKIRDGVKYQLALLTSATAEGAFEASDVYHRGKQELEQQFFDIYGRSASGQELENIDQQAKVAGDFAMKSNIGLLYISNRINWGSLFKPTTRAFEEGITGWGSSIARTSVKQAEMDATGKIAYSVATKSPESRIGKILLNGEKIARVGSRSINEAIEEGSQYAISEGAIDYAKTKYSPNNLKQVGDFMTSFNKGVKGVLGTKEGLDNVVGGFIGGILGGGIMNRVQRKTPIATRLQQQVELLNSASFNGTLANRYQEVATGFELADQHTQAVKNGDIYKAKNVKYDMLYNWVSSGVRANAYEKRMDELRTATQLEGQSFTNYWGVADTQQNRDAVKQYADGIEKKSDVIRKHVEKVNRLTKNPHAVGTADYAAYESYKDELSLNLSRYDEYQRRVRSVSDDLRRAYPLLDIQNAVNMTSVQGMAQTLKAINKAVNDINTQLVQVEDVEEFTKPLKENREKLNNIFERLQKIVYSGTKNQTTELTQDVSFMRDLFNLYNGSSIQQNNYLDGQRQLAETNLIQGDQRSQDEINDDQLADNLQALQDVYKLSEANYNIGKYYTYLRKGLGEKQFTDKIKQIIEANQQFLTDDGKIQTPQDVEDNVRQDAYLEIDPRETTLEERDIIKEAAKKETKGQALTEEELAVTNKHPEVFVDYIKAEEKVETTVTEKTSKTKDLEKETNPKAPKSKTEDGDVPATTNNKQYDGVTPEALLISAHRNKFVDGLLDRLSNFIFNNTQEDIAKNLQAYVEEREIVRDNNINKIGSSNLYRQDFTNYIAIASDEGIIGEMRPPSTLFLDQEGKQPLFTEDGKLNLNEQSYTTATGNDISTFQDFKNKLEAYETSYNGLYNEAQNGEVDFNTINKYFNLSLNTGSLIINEKSKKDADTKLKDVKLKNQAVIQINEQANSDGTTTYVASIKATFGTVNLNTRNAIKKFVADNQEQFSQFNNKLMVAFPVFGQVEANSFVRGRMKAKANNSYAEFLYLAAPSQVYENFTLNFNPKTFTEATAQPTQEAKQPQETTGKPKGSINVNGKVITLEGVPGQLDFTGNTKDTNFSTMMPEVTALLKNWDAKFVNDNFVNFNGQFIFNFSGRVMMLAKVGNFIVPYYFSSSGTSGKAIDWHYIFGVDQDSGWIIKGGVNDKGEVVYNKQLTALYPKAIAALEALKNDMRSKVAMTTETRDNVAQHLDRYNLGKDKYTKSLSSIYKDLDVVENRTQDGIETNDNYTYLLNATLGLIGLDNVAPATAPAVEEISQQIEITREEKPDVITQPILNEEEFIPTQQVTDTRALTTYTNINSADNFADSRDYWVEDYNGNKLSDDFETNQEAEEFIKQYNKDNNLVEEPAETLIITIEEQVEENDVTNIPAEENKQAVINVKDLKVIADEGDTFDVQYNGESIGAMAKVKEDGETLWLDAETRSADNIIGSTKQEALQFIANRYNEANGLTVEKQNAKGEFYSFTTTLKNGTIVKTVAKLIEDQKNIRILEDKYGNRFERAKSGTQIATVEDYEQYDDAQVEKPTPKYKVGDRVQDNNGNKTTINEVIFEQVPNKLDYQIFYKTAKGATISEAGIKGYYRQSGIAKNQTILAEHQAIKNTIVNVARHFNTVFPQIKIQIGYYDEFNTLARFYNGFVQVNLNYVDTYDNATYKEAVLHEFMHPFVLAMKTSNIELHTSLIQELYVNHPEIIDSIADADHYAKDNSDLTKATKDDEALTIYLGRELNKAFDSNGAINQEYVRSRNILQRFISWLGDVVSFLRGKRKPKSLEQFVRDANNNKAELTNTINSVINSNDVLKTYLADKDRVSTKIKKLVDNKAKVRNEILAGQEVLANEIYRLIDSYINETASGTGKFEFIIGGRLGENNVEFDTRDPNSIKVYIDPSVNQEYSIGDILLRAGAKLDNNVADQYAEVVRNNFYKDTSKAKNKEENFNVADLNPLMKLQDVSDFVLYQLDNTQQRELDQFNKKYGRKKNIEYTKEDSARIQYLQAKKANRFTIQYDPIQLNAIENLEAYMSVDNDVATKTRKQIISKLEALRDTANRRYNSETLRINYNTIRALDRDIKDDAQFIYEYTAQASASINQAWRKYNEITEDVRAKKGSLTKAELNKMNKELSVVRQLLGFYDNFTKLVKDTNFGKTESEQKEYFAFLKSMSYIEAIRQGMQNAAIDLTVEWFNPYMEQHNKYIQKEGYKDDKYLLTPDKLREHFKFGVGRDTNFITFWLGANITSRNPVNATFANTLSDALSFNNIDTTNDATTINLGFNDFLKRTNFNNLSAKQQTQYYKDNYMRQAEMLQRRYNKTTDDYEDVYVKKWALHQEFLFDQYEKDLTEERKKYVNPRNAAEEQAFTDAINQWQKDRNYGKTAKYINPAYAKAKADPFFQTLEKFYNSSNVRYGDNALRFGIVPQQYSGNFLQKVKKLIKDVKGDDKAIEKYTTIKQSLRNSFAGVSKDNDTLNLDGSVYKTVNTTLTDTNKDEENINLNLHESVVEFVVESRNYSTLKDTQYNAETLMLLLQGNEKFGVPARKFANADFTKKITSLNQWELAKNELAKLDDDKAAHKTIDQVYYDKVKKRVDDGVKDVNAWDKFLPRLKSADTNYNNEMLVRQINDVYFGESTEQVRIVNVSANRLAHYLSLYTSINSMAGNVIAGLSNINTGNLQLFIESMGGKYFTKGDLAKATLSYGANIGDYIKDLQTPIKSKDTQLSLLMDAIQGEIQDEFGVRVTGNISRKLLRPNSLFFLTSLGEHQIQITGMKAMLLGRKLETNDGKIINLYDAFVADKNGRYNLRTDVKFTQHDLAKFIRDLHGVNRSLNGNYSEFNKTMLQRKWYGNLAMKFRKYLYSSFRTRWASEHTDYERNTVEVGYLRYFGKYLIDGTKSLLKNENGFSEHFSTKNLQPHQKYALRKAATELGFALAITMLAIALVGGGDDKKKLSTAEKTALLLMERLRGDIGTFSWQMPAEFTRQIKSPTASLTTIVATAETLQQLFNPSETYQQDYGTHKEGDSKLRAKFEKLIPFHSSFNMFNGNFEGMIDEKLGVFNLINKNIEGVTPVQTR